MGKRRNKPFMPRGWRTAHRKLNSNLRKYRERKLVAQERDTDQPKEVLLEKKKDFLVRINKRHRSEKRKKYFNLLIQDRNPDEYDPAMKFCRKDFETNRVVFDKFRVNEKQRLREELGRDDVNDMLVLKRRKRTVRRRRAQATNKNLNLLKYKLAVLQKRIGRLKSKLQFSAVSSSTSSSRRKRPKHIIFVKKRKEVRVFDPARRFDTDPALIAAGVAPINRLRKSALMDRKKHFRTASGVGPQGPVGASSVDYQKLTKMVQREANLSRAIREIQLAMQVASNRDAVEDIIRASSDEDSDSDSDDGKKGKRKRKGRGRSSGSSVLVGDLKGVRAVRFRRQRKR